MAKGVPSIIGRLRLIAIALCMVATPASAARFHYDFTAASMLDDNLFRVAGPVRDGLGKNARDWIKQAGVLVGVEQDWSSWQLNASATGQKTWFKNNDYLDNTGYDLESQLQRKGERSSVEITGSAQRQLSSFSDVNSVERNVHSLSNARIESTREIAGHLRAIASVAFTQNTNSSDLIAPNDYRRLSVTGGLGYYSPTGSILALQGEVRRSNGLSDRTVLIGAAMVAYRADYTDKTIALRALWTPSVLWQLDSKIGYTWHHDRSGIARDFDGITGNLNLRWSPLRSLTATLAASRQFESSSGLFSNGIRESNISFSVQASVTKTLLAQFTAARQWRTYRYDLTGGSALAGRSERVNRISGTLSYLVTDRLTFSGMLSRQQRSSAVAAFRFTETMATAALTWSLGQRSQPI